jgi:hypothetical protein
MRPVVAALLGTALSMGVVTAQSSEEPPSGRAAAHKKHVPTAIDALFENGPERPNAIEEVNREAAERKARSEKAAEPAAPTQPATPPTAPMLPTVQAVPPGPPQKNLTGQEFGLIRVGSTVKDVLQVLGPPSSRIVIPDDDGHLRETLEYWVKGNPMATVRADNGRVVDIDTERK